MSFVRDLFATNDDSNLPLTHISAPQDDVYPPNDAAEPGPSAPPLLTARHHLSRTASSVPHDDAPPYEEDFNSRAPRLLTDHTRLYPPRPPSVSLSACSSVTSTPLPSRAPSPLQSYYSGTSSCDSDSEDEPDSPLLSRTRQEPPWRETERPRWFLRLRTNDARRGRLRWRDVVWGLRSCKRLVRRLVRHPFFPKTPVTIVSVLLSSLRRELRVSGFCADPGPDTVSGLASYRVSVFPSG